MKIRRTLVLAIAWVVSLLGVGLWAQGIGGGQMVVPGQPGQPTRALSYGEPVGDIITGDSIGFQRVVAPPNKEGRVVGKLMVKINDQWYEAASPLRLVPLGR